MTRGWTTVVLALLLGLTGCGNSQGPAPEKAYPVKGKVLLANGEPVRSGRVILHPKDNPLGVECFGEIQADGSFQLTTYKLNDGAVPGHYIVTVTPFSYKTGNLKVSGAGLIPKRYTEAETSGLDVDIKPEDNVLPPFQLR
jgi:hypothetical protein